MPPIILEPYDSTIKPVRTLKVSNGTGIQAEKQDRIDKIIELLNMESLNQLERDSIIKLVSYFPCQFHLLRENLAKPLESLTKYQPPIISPLTLSSAVTHLTYATRFDNKSKT